MSKHVIVAGIDVGAEELWVAVAGHKPRPFKHNYAGIRSLHRWVSRQVKGTTVHYCFEATGTYSIHVAMRLLSLDDVRISIVNPSVIVAFARTQGRRSKTDPIDAEVIRRYAQHHRPPLWSPESKARRHLAMLVAQADALKGILRQWENRHHSYGFVHDLPMTIAQCQKSIKRSLSRQLRKLEQAINSLCATDSELAHQIALLETIPGIARCAATQLLAYGGSRWQRYSARAMTAQAGLAPKHHRSGSSVSKKERIDKQGDRRLRKALYMPALVGVRYNPILKEHYDRLCNNGKMKKVALTACMRKLLTIVRAILVSKRPFQSTNQHLT